MLQRTRTSTPWHKIPTPLATQSQWAAVAQNNEGHATALSRKIADARGHAGGWTGMAGSDDMGIATRSITTEVRHAVVIAANAIVNGQKAALIEMDVPG